MVDPCVTQQQTNNIRAQGSKYGQSNVGPMWAALQAAATHERTQQLQDPHEHETRVAQKLFRVPYGTLLCVSDRPLHGEIKLPGTAEDFYRARVNQHLKIGLRAMAVMKDAARTGSLHSRKLRSQDEPVFR